MNANKKIVLTDRSNGLIFFCIDFFEQLDNSNYNIVLIADEGRSYGDFFDVLERFDIRPSSGDMRGDLNILISASGTRAEDRFDLVYPVFAGEIPAFKKSRSGFIPVSKHPGSEIVRPHYEDAMDFVNRFFAEQDLSGKNVLVSAGPTIEDIDPVRFLSNRSSGKMGIALARAAWHRGAALALVCGPIQQRCGSHIRRIQVRSAAEMAEAVSAGFDKCDYFFSAAAVADYTPAEIHSHKMKKKDGDLQLELKRTQDILTLIKSKKRPDQKVIGFSVETENSRQNSHKKLLAKGMDFVCINNPSEEGAGFGHDTNRVDILDKEGRFHSLPVLSKMQTAHRILDELKEGLDGRLP